MSDRKALHKIRSLARELAVVSAAPPPGPKSSTPTITGMVSVFVQEKRVARFVLLTTPGTDHAWTAGSPWSWGGATDLGARRRREEQRYSDSEHSDSLRHEILRSCRGWRGTAIPPGPRVRRSPAATLHWRPAHAVVSTSEWMRSPPGIRRALAPPGLPSGVASRCRVDADAGLHAPEESRASGAGSCRSGSRPRGANIAYEGCQCTGLARTCYL